MGWIKDTAKGNTETADAHSQPCASCGTPVENGAEELYCTRCKRHFDYITHGIFFDEEA